MYNQGNMRLHVDLFIKPAAILDNRKSLSISPF